MSRRSDESSVDAIDRLIDEGLRDFVQGGPPPWLSARVRSRLERREGLEGRSRDGLLGVFGHAALWPRLAGVGALAALAIVVFVLLRPHPSTRPEEAVAQNRSAAGDTQAQARALPSGPEPGAASPAPVPPEEAAGRRPGPEAGVTRADAARGSARPPTRRGPLVIARSSEEARRLGLARVPEIDRPSTSPIYVLLEGEPDTGRGPEPDLWSATPPARPIEVAALLAPAGLDITPLEVNPIAVREIAIQPIDVKPLDPGGPRGPAPGSAGNEDSPKR